MSEMQQPLLVSIDSTSSLPEALDAADASVKPEETGPDLDTFDVFATTSLVRRIDARRRTRSFFKRRALIRWFLIGMVAFSTASVALGVWILTRSLHSIKIGIVRDLIASGRQVAPMVAHCVVSGVFVAIAAVLVAFLEPVAMGSGIPQIKCILNGLKIPRVVRAKTLLVKAVGVAFSVSGGLPVGIEGPMIHSGAICGAGISQGKSSVLGFDTSFTKFPGFRNDKEKRDFVSAGAAAGVACAFGAPIGGVLFSLEEGSSFWNQKLTWRTFFCSMMAYFLLAMCTSAMLEDSQWGRLNDSSMFTFGDFTALGQNEFTYSAYELPLFVLMGAFGGLVGALYNHMNMRLSQWRRVSVQTSSRRIVEAVGTALLFAFISFAVPFYLRDRCEPFSTEMNVQEQFIQFYCPEGHFSPIASLLLNPFDDAIKVLFHSTHVFDLAELLVVFVYMFCSSCWCYGLSVPSGLFVPTLYAGACFGRLIGQLVHEWVSLQTVDSGTYALIGAAAVLGGMARMTISLTVILIEATGDIQYGLPVMVTLMTARWVGGLFNEGLYDIHIHLNGWQFLEFDPPPIIQYLLAYDIMKTLVISLNEVERAGHVHDVLSQCHHNGFPIVDSASDGSSLPGFRGMINRKHLTVLLQNRCFVSEMPTPYKCKPLMGYRDMERSYPRYPTIDTIKLSDEERDMWMDLTPYMDPAPYAVQQLASASTVFCLYRTMGLRHIPVVNKSNRLVGIITRKDLTSMRFRKQLAELVEDSGNGFACGWVDDDVAQYPFVRNFLDRVPDH